MYALNTTHRLGERWLIAKSIPLIGYYRYHLGPDAGTVFSGFSLAQTLSPIDLLQSSEAPASLRSNR